MSKPKRADVEAVDLEFTFFDLHHHQGRRQGVQRYREDHRIHLAAEDLLERDPLLLGSVYDDRGFPAAKGFEERQPLDVIPVGVRQEDISGEDAIALLHQHVAERTQSAAGIEDDQPVVRSGNADAGGVAAVPRGLGPWSWDRTSGTPERHLMLHRDSSSRWGLCRNLSASAGAQPCQQSRPVSDGAHALRAASIRERRSLRVMSLRVTWMMPRSTRLRMVRDTVSRLEPIICAMVWWVSFRVMRSPPSSS